MRAGDEVPTEAIVQVARLFGDEITLDNAPRAQVRPVCAAAVAAAAAHHRLASIGNTHTGVHKQLVAMAKYMGIPPYGADSFLRFQLRNHICIIKDDDKVLPRSPCAHSVSNSCRSHWCSLCLQQIIWEGIDTLSKEELIAACEERGMRADGLSTWRLRRQLQQWLDLSVDKNVPTSLLILSRALTITATVREQVATVASIALPAPRRCGLMCV